MKAEWEQKREWYRRITSALTLALVKSGPRFVLDSMDMIDRLIEQEERDEADREQIEILLCPRPQPERKSREQVSGYETPGDELEI